MDNGIDAFLRPRSVAVIGASSQEGKIGNIIVNQLRGGQFAVYPVNPKGGTVCGLTAYMSIRDTPEVPDLAVLALPAEPTVGAVADCVQRGVRGVVAVAGGFGETGETGRAMEQLLAGAIRGSRTRLLGPNTLGILAPAYGLDTVFLSPERFQRPGAGSLALVSQSGSAILGELDNAALLGVTVSAFVGLGNRLDLEENEMISYFSHDPATSVIGVYLESFADAGGFLEVCRRVVAEKPIVLLKAGCSESGARAVQLHTGSLAGSDRLTEGAMKQAGVIRVHDAEELLDVGRGLAYAPPVKGRRVAVLTNGGGWGILAADSIEAKGRAYPLRLAALEPRTMERLLRATLPYAAVRNPVDITASATNEMFGDALAILEEDPGVDVVLCCFGFQPPAIDERLTEVLSHQAKNGKKPLVVSLMGSDPAIRSLRQLEAAGVAAYPSTQRAVRAIEALVQRGEYLRGLDRPVLAAAPQSMSEDAARIALCESGTPLAEDQVKAILRGLGVSVPNSVVLRADEKLDLIPLTYPLVVKVRSAAILHKTEQKGVVLGIQDRVQLESTVEEMRSRFPGGDLLIEEMVSKGLEIIIGLIEDSTFGLSIMCGLGGVLAELYQDVTFRRLPIDRRDAGEMLGELKGRMLFEGFRGMKADREAVIDLLLKLSRFGESLSGKIDQMDLNPVMVHAQGAVAVDAKLIWRPEAVERDGAAGRKCVEMTDMPKARAAEEDNNTLFLGVQGLPVSNR